MCNNVIIMSCLESSKIMITNFNNNFPAIPKIPLSHRIPAQIRNFDLSQPLIWAEILQRDSSLVFLPASLLSLFRSFSSLKSYYDLSFLFSLFERFPFPFSFLSQSVTHANQTIGHSSGTTYARRSSDACPEQLMQKGTWPVVLPTAYWEERSRFHL